MVEAIVGALGETDTFGLIEVARPDVEHFEARPRAKYPAHRRFN